MDQDIIYTYTRECCDSASSRLKNEKFYKLVYGEECLSSTPTTKSDGGLPYEVR